MSFAEYVVPRTNILRQDIKELAKQEERLELSDLSFGLSKRREMDRHKVYLSNGDGRIIYAQFYNSEQQLATNVWILNPKGVDEQYAGYKTRIDARMLQFNDNGWVLLNAKERIFTPNGERITEKSSIQADFINLKPSDFARIDLEPEEMNFFELKNYIKQVRNKGGDASEWLVDLYLKIAFPFASLIIVFFGAPLVAGSPTQGKAAAFGVALIICFIYYMLINAFKIIGRTDAVDPMLAAWLPNILFFFIGLFMHFRAAK
jgi:lipopolysaccharide export system permease protein